MLLKNKGARKIVLAVPVAGPGTRDEIARTVDEVVVLEEPEFYQAVAQVYEHWYDVPDEEVLEIMKRWDEEQAPPSE